MDLNLRNAVLANIATNDQSQLEATITEAIADGEEKMLPGLGVLFELIWNQSPEEDRREMITALEQGVKVATTN